jgi:hypothetical protein
VHSLAIKHAIQIVVRGEQQVHGIAERLVIGEPGRIGVAMRADDRQVAYRRVQRARQRARPDVGRKKAVRV